MGPGARDNVGLRVWRGTAVVGLFSYFDDFGLTGGGYPQVSALTDKEQVVSTRMLRMGKRDEASSTHAGWCCPLTPSDLRPHTRVGCHANSRLTAQPALT